MVLEFDNCCLSPTSPASSSKNELYIFHHIWRLEDAIERSETNPGRSLGDNNIIKNFAWKAIHFLMSSSKNELYIFHHIWRLEDAIERSESNPGRSLGDSDNIKNLA